MPGVRAANRRSRPSGGHEQCAERGGAAVCRTLFDTNLLIDYLQGIEDAKAEIERHRTRLISIVTWMEVLIGARDEAEADVIEMFLRDFRTVDITRPIARDAVEIRKARRIRVPDAIVWSTPRRESALLVTRNCKEFPPGEPGVRIPY